MLCASHCNFFEYPQSITGSFIFSLFNFQGPTHFLESFCRFLPNLSQQCVNYYITLIFVCQHFFQTFLKSFLKSLSKLFKSFTLCSQTFLLFLCCPPATLLLYHAFLQIATLFFNFFQIFLKNFYFIFINTIYRVYIMRIYYY